ncbi:MAG: CHC2 zinc finger domain-containing protein, partial [Parafilimonas sp.]
MKFRNNLPSVEEVKNTDMVDYLLSLGFKPAKVTRNDYWYLSPFRDETTASFKVNRNLNRWYDFGEGKGGNIIDFGILYHRCTVKELLAKFAQPFSFEKHNVQPHKEDEEAKKIKIIKHREISSFGLVRYLHKRRIPVDIARKFCCETDYELYGKNYYAIGFKNDAGGYELRNEKFKAG